MQEFLTMGRICGKEYNKFENVVMWGYLNAATWEEFNEEKLNCFCFLYFGPHLIEIITFLEVVHLKIDPLHKIRYSPSIAHLNIAV